jgi:hypothetical protein
MWFHGPHPFLLYCLLFACKNRVKSNCNLFENFPSLQHATRFGPNGPSSRFIQEEKENHLLYFCISNVKPADGSFWLKRVAGCQKDTFTAVLDGVLRYWYL